MQLLSALSTGTDVSWPKCVSEVSWTFVIFPEQLTLLGSYGTFKSAKRTNKVHFHMAPRKWQKASFKASPLWGHKAQQQISLKPTFLLPNITLDSQPLRYWRFYQKKLMPASKGIRQEARWEGLWIWLGNLFSPLLWVKKPQLRKKGILAIIKCSRKARL